MFAIAVGSTSSTSSHLKPKAAAAAAGVLQDLVALLPMKMRVSTGWLFGQGKAGCCCSSTSNSTVGYGNGPVDSQQQGGGGRMCPPCSGRRRATIGCRGARGGG